MHLLEFSDASLSLFRGSSVSMRSLLFLFRTRLLCAKQTNVAQLIFAKPMRQSQRCVDMWSTMSIMNTLFKNAYIKCIKCKDATRGLLALLLGVRTLLSTGDIATPSDRVPRSHLLQEPISPSHQQGQKAPPYLPPLLAQSDELLWSKLSRISILKSLVCISNRPRPNIGWGSPY